MFKFFGERDDRCLSTIYAAELKSHSLRTDVPLCRSGLSNFSAMAGRINFILGLAGHYAISATVKAMFECEL